MDTQISELNYFNYAKTALTGRLVLICNVLEYAIGSSQYGVISDV